MWFSASPEFLSSGHAKSDDAAHRVRDHQPFIRAHDAHRDPRGVGGNHPVSVRVVRLIVRGVPSANSPVETVVHGRGISRARSQ